MTVNLQPIVQYLKLEYASSTFHVILYYVLPFIIINWIITARFARKWYKFEIDNNSMKPHDYRDFFFTIVSSPLWMPFRLIGLGFLNFTKLIVWFFSMGGRKEVKPIWEEESNVVFPQKNQNKVTVKKGNFEECYDAPVKLRSIIPDATCVVSHNNASGFYTYPPELDCMLYWDDRVHVVVPECNEDPGVDVDAFFDALEDEEKTFELKIKGQKPTLLQANGQSLFQVAETYGKGFNISFQFIQRGDKLFYELNTIIQPNDLVFVMPAIKVYVKGHMFSDRVFMAYENMSIRNFLKYIGAGGSTAMIERNEEVQNSSRLHNEDKLIII